MIGQVMFGIIVILILVLYAILGFKKPAIAIVTLPIAMAAVYVVSYAPYPDDELFASVAATVIIFFVTLIAVLSAKRETDIEQWPQVLAKWLLIFSGILLVSVIALIFFGSGGSFGFIFFVAFIGFSISYISTSRYATAAYVVSTIGSSIRQNLPLAMALESAASGQNDKRSRILRSISKWLVQGYSLSESIKCGYPKCPSRAVAMIAAAEKIDQLPFAIKAIEADMVAKADENKRIKTVYPLYPVIVIVFMFFIVLMLMRYVIPRFMEVLMEITDGATIPAATRILIRIAEFIAYEYGGVIGLILLFILFVYFGVGIRARFRPRRPDKPYFRSRIGDFFKWHLPILHWFEKNYSMIQVVELLRLSLNAGCTVNDAIANTLGLDVNNCFKRRLRRWLAKVEAGGDIATSAKESRLGSTLAWAFDEQVNKGNTLAVLETLESFHRSNYSYRVNFIMLMMGPCITIIMGMMVGFVAYAVFSPIVAIINHLVNSVVP